MTSPAPTLYDSCVSDARKLLAERDTYSDPPSDRIAMAQVMATLAVAEQARTANLIAAQAHNRNVVALHPEIEDSPRTFARSAYLAAEIRAALGGPQLAGQEMTA